MDWYPRVSEAYWRAYDEVYAQAENAQAATDAGNKAGVIAFRACLVAAGVPLPSWLDVRAVTSPVAPFGTRFVVLFMPTCPAGHAREGDVDPAHWNQEGAFAICSAALGRVGTILQIDAVRKAAAKIGIHVVVTDQRSLAGTCVRAAPGSRLCGGLCTASAAQVDEQAVADVSAALFHALHGLLRRAHVARPAATTPSCDFTVVFCGKASSTPRFLAAAETDRALSPGGAGKDPCVLPAIR